MCQTMPIKIKEIKGKKAELEDGRTVDINLIEKLKVGDWVLAYANVATKKIADHEAKEILKLFKHDIGGF